MDADIYLNKNLAGDEYSNIINTINKLSFDYETGIDYKNKKSYYEVNTNYDNDLLINTNIYTQNNKLYVYLKDILSKYIEIENVDVSALYDIESNLSNDYIYVFQTILDYSVDSLEKDDFVKEKNKITYILDNTKIKKVGESTTKKLIKDKKFIDTVAKLSKLSKDEVITKLEEMNFKTEEKINIEIAVYLNSKDNAEKIEITSKSDIKELLTYEIKDNRTLTYKRDNEVIFTLTYDQKENGSTFNMNIPSINMDMKVDTKANTKNITSDITIKIKDSDISLQGKLIYNNEKLKSNFDFDLKLLQDKEKLLNIKFTNQNTKTLHKKIEIPTMDNIIKVDELTETEEEEMYNNIVDNDIVIKFIEDLTSKM